jgi:hypothetical protein
MALVLENSPLSPLINWCFRGVLVFTGTTDLTNGHSGLNSQEGSLVPPASTPWQNYSVIVKTYVPFLCPTALSIDSFSGLQENRGKLPSLATRPRKPCSPWRPHLNWTRTLLLINAHTQWNPMFLKFFSLFRNQPLISEAASWKDNGLPCQSGEDRFE